MERTNESAIFEMRGLRKKETVLQEVISAGPEPRTLKRIVEKIDSQLAKLGGQIGVERSHLEDLESRVSGLFEARAFLVDAVRETYPKIAAEFDRRGDE